MADESEYTYMSCGCEPESRSRPADECDFCTPRLELTPEEEAILARMRAIKERVRPIAARLNELQDRFERPPDREATDGTRSEWDELSAELAALRGQWNDWQAKLDQAIENKLVLLGHH